MYSEMNLKVNQSFNDNFVILNNGSIKWEHYSKNVFLVNSKNFEDVVYLNYNSSFANKTDSLNKWPYFFWIYSSVF